MENTEFKQIYASLLTFFIFIIIFNAFGINLDFIIALILALFSVTISIFFYKETNNTLNKITEKLEIIDRNTAKERSESAKSKINKRKDLIKSKHELLKKSLLDLKEELK